MLRMTSVGKPERQDRRGQQQVAAQIGGIQNQQDRVRAWRCRRAVPCRTSWVTCSSSDRGARLYNPGRSMSSACLPCSSLTFPVRCSTVTPGKLATFWRRPVSRLKRVDLPELGGPMIATTAGAGPMMAPDGYRRPAPVAMAHAGSRCGGRNFKQAAVSRRKANSDPSTR